jgi:hypothetical protein
MKRSIIILSALIGFFIFSSTSCEDPEPFFQVKEIESAIYNEIKAHRESNGIAGPFVQQFVIVVEAQLYSATMAFGSQDVSTSGIDSHWTIIHDKIGGTNDLALVQSTISSTSAADMVKAWTEVPEIDSVLLLDYSQCGTGVEINNGIAYITLMMMLVE